MDIIAIVYRDSQETVELRRMDWVKVNSITLSQPVTSICFSPDGRTICIATSNNAYLYEIEHSKLLSSKQFDSEITCIYVGECNSMTITVIGFEDSTVSIFSDFHYAMSQFILPLPAMKFSLSDTALFALQDDGMTVSRFDMPFIINKSSIIRPTSEALSSYWVYKQTIDNAWAKLGDMWKRVWDEAEMFTPYRTELAKGFLCGIDPPEISTEVHRERVCKTMQNELHQIRELVANEIIPAFIGLNKATEKLKAALTMSQSTGISVPSGGFAAQLKGCLVIIENSARLEKCFTALFEYLKDSHGAVLPMSSTEFADFLVNYISPFDLPDIGIQEHPSSQPIFEMESKGDFPLPGRLSSVTGSKWVCIGQNVEVLDLLTGEKQEYDVDGHPLAAYAFMDGDEEVGCFYENGGKASFKMFNGEDENGHDVGLVDATVFVISPRRIAFVQSTQLFCSVVDLATVDEDEEEEDDGDE